MLDALILLERQTESPRLSEALLVMQAAVRDGRSLSEAMGSLPKDFSKVHVSLVRAGEGTGLLSVVLGQVAALEEREQELKTRVRAALMYPTITAIVGLATILVILSFVVPRLSSIFEEMDQALPLITRVLLLLSSVAQWIWTYALVFILAGLLALGFLPKSRRWSLFKDRFLLRLPRLGHLIMTMQVARFAGILGALLRNGVAMVPALGVTAETLDSRVVRSKLRSAVRRVNQGERLGVALEKERVLPQVVTGMITVGESTGNLETTLGRISESSTREAERMVRTLVGLVEPSLIILMGLFVAFIVAAVIIPIFQVNLAM
jgi:general secretion pathway protein F